MTDYVKFLDEISRPHRISLAESQVSNMDLARAILRHTDGYVHVAANSLLTEDILFDVVSGVPSDSNGSRETRILTAAITHVNASVRVIKDAVAKADPDLAVLKALASGSAIDGRQSPLVRLDASDRDAVLLLIAKKGRIGLKRQIAGNHLAGTLALKSLIRTKDEDIINNIKKRRDISTEIIVHYAKWKGMDHNTLLLFCLGDHMTPHLDTLIDSGSIEVARMVAAGRQLPPAIESKLLAMDDIGVDEAIANRTENADTLGRLWERRGAAIAADIIINKSAPEALRDKCLAAFPKQNMFTKTAKKSIESKMAELGDQEVAEAFVEAQRSDDWNEAKDYFTAKLWRWVALRVAAKPQLSVERGVRAGQINGIGYRAYNDVEAGVLAIARSESVSPETYENLIGWFTPLILSVQAEWRQINQVFYKIADSALATPTMIKTMIRSGIFANISNPDRSLLSAIDAKIGRDLSVDELLELVSQKLLPEWFIVSLTNCPTEVTRRLLNDDQHGWFIASNTQQPSVVVDYVKKAIESFSVDDGQPKPSRRHIMDVFRELAKNRHLNAAEYTEVHELLAKLPAAERQEFGAPFARNPHAPDKIVLDFAKSLKGQNSSYQIADIISYATLARLELMLPTGWLASVATPNDIVLIDRALGQKLFNSSPGFASSLSLELIRSLFGTSQPIGIDSALGPDGERADTNLANMDFSASRIQLITTLFQDPPSEARNVRLALVKELRPSDYADLIVCRVLIDKFNYSRNISLFTNDEVSFVLANADRTLRQIFLTSSPADEIIAKVGEEAWVRATLSLSQDGLLAVFRSQADGLKVKRGRVPSDLVLEVAKQVVSGNFAITDTRFRDEVMSYLLASDAVLKDHNIVTEILKMCEPEQIPPMLVSSLDHQMILGRLAAMSEEDLSRAMRACYGHYRDLFPKGALRAELINSLCHDGTYKDLLFAMLANKASGVLIRHLFFKITSDEGSSPSLLAALADNFLDNTAYPDDFSEGDGYAHALISHKNASPAMLAKLASHGLRSFERSTAERFFTQYMGDVEGAQKKWRDNKRAALITGSIDRYLDMMVSQEDGQDELLLKIFGGIEEVKHRPKPQAKTSGTQYVGLSRLFGDLPAPKNEETTEEKPDAVSKLKVSQFEIIAIAMSPRCPTDVLWAIVGDVALVSKPRAAAVVSLNRKRSLDIDRLAVDILGIKGKAVRRRISEGLAEAEFGTFFILEDLFRKSASGDAWVDILELSDSEKQDFYTTEKYDALLDFAAPILMPASSEDYFKGYGTSDLLSSLGRIKKFYTPETWRTFVRRSFLPKPPTGLEVASNLQKREAQFTELRDVLAIYKSNQDSFDEDLPAVPPEEIRDIKSLHDKLVTMSAKYRNPDFFLYKEDRDEWVAGLHGRSIGHDLFIHVPQTRHQLIAWGEEKHFCIGVADYANRTIEGRIALLGLVDEKGELTYCAEIAGEKLIQCRGLRNADAPPGVKTSLMAIWQEARSKTPATS